MFLLVDPSSISSMRFSRSTITFQILVPCILDGFVVTDDARGSSPFPLAATAACNRLELFDLQLGLVPLDLKTTSRLSARSSIAAFRKRQIAAAHHFDKSFSCWAIVAFNSSIDVRRSS